MPFSRYWWGQVFKILLLALRLFFVVASFFFSGLALSQGRYDVATFFLNVIILVIVSHN